MTSRIAFGVLGYVRAASDEIVARFPFIPNVWGIGPNPDHNNKRCVDFMVRNKPDGDTLATWLVANADRLGVKYIIWWEHIWRMHGGYVVHGELVPSREWTRYYGTPNPHHDHNHVEFYRDDATYHPPVSVVKRKPTVVPYVVTAHGGLYGLVAPGPARVKVDSRNNPRGRVLNIARIVHGKDGRKWGVTRWNTYYSMQYLKKGKTL